MAEAAAAKGSSALDEWRKNKPYKVYMPKQDYSGSDGITAFRWLKRFLAFIVSHLLNILGFLIVGLLIFVIVVFITNCTKLGGCSLILEHGVLNIKTGASKIEAQTGFLSTFWDIITTGGASQIGQTNFGEIKPEDNKKFIELKDVKAGETYFEREPINVQANLFVHSVGKETVVEIYCELEDYKDLITYELPNQEIGQISSFKIPENTKDNFPILCNFEKGITLDSQSVLVDSKKGKMRVIYNSNAQSKWRPYILHSSYIRRLQIQGKDPAEEIKDDPAYSESAGINGMKTELEYESAIQLEIKSGSSMPFYENRYYSLTVALTEMNDFAGNLFKLNDLFIVVPSTVDLETSSSSCDFEYKDTNEQGKIYSVKKSLVNRINDQCTSESLKKFTISRNECIRLYKSNIEANCRMRFNIDTINDSPTFLNFIATADYGYELEDEFIVDIRKTV